MKKFIVFVLTMCFAGNIFAADVTITIPKDKVPDLSDAVDKQVHQFKVKILPYNEWNAQTGGTKLDYAKYIFVQSLKNWYRASLDKDSKEDYNSNVEENKTKDLELSSL